MKGTEAGQDGTGRPKIGRGKSLRLTIGVKFVSLVVLVALLAGGIVGLVTIKTSQNALRQEILHSNLAQANLAADFVSNYMKATQTPLQVLAARADIRAAVMNNTPEGLQATLAEFIQTQTALQACAVFDVSGIQRVSSLSPSDGVGKSFADREWFKQVAATGQPFQSKPIMALGNVYPIAPFAIPILDDQGQFKGALTGTISLTILSNAIVNIDYGCDTRATLIDIRNGGLVLADREPQLLIKPVLGENEAIKRLLAGESGMIETTSSGGSLDLVGFTQVPDLPWGIMIITPSSSALAVVTTLTHNASLFTVLIILLAVIVGIILVLGITKPVSRLVEGTQEISQGNLDFKITIKNQDEIGDLFQAFRRMTETLKNTLVSRDNLAQEVAERLKVEETLKRTLVSRDELEREVAERKKTEYFLKSSEENFRNSMDNSPMGIRIFGKDGVTLYANQALLDIWGYENLAEMKAMPVENLFSAQGQAYLQIRRDRILRGEAVSDNYENFIVRKDGAQRLVQVVRKEVMWGGERRYQALYLDITERKQAEEDLITSEENFRNSLDNSPLGIRIVAEGGETLYTNQAFLDIYGYIDQAEFDAIPFEKRYSPESSVEIQKRIDRRKAGGPISGNNEISIVHKDGKLRRLQVFYKNVLWRGEMQYLAFYLDITERKQAEETLKLASQQLEESYTKEKKQRLELEEEARARGMLIDILGHELRTPLTPLTVCADMLQTAYSTQERGIEKELVGNICNSAKYLALRLEELLDMAKYSRGTFTLDWQKVNIADLINQITAQFKPLADQQGKRLTLEIKPGLPEIESDPACLEKVLVNLLSNAFKYSPKDSSIMLKTRKQGSNLIIEVQDEGRGLSADEQEKLFNPYHRVQQDTQKYPGIGLGLAVTKQIVEAHGGKIRVESQPGQGSTFIVKLPINQLREETNEIAAG